MDKVRKMIKKYVIFVIYTFVFMGCNGPNSCPICKYSDGFEWTPQKYAERIESKHDLNNVITRHHSRKLYKFIYRDICNGYQNSIANFILNSSKWRKRKWYSYVESEFSQIWYNRKYPIALAASPTTIKSLIYLAQKGMRRKTRVSSALIIRDLEINLAKNVLIDEYAKFVVPPSYSAYMVIGGEPMVTYEALHDMGIKVLPEITNINKICMFLKDHPKWKQKDPNDIKIITYTANLYNKSIRDIYDKKDVEGYNKYLNNIKQLVHECYDKSLKTDIKKPGMFTEDSGLFNKSFEELKKNEN